MNYLGDNKMPDQYTLVHNHLTDKFMCAAQKHHVIPFRLYSKYNGTKVLKYSGAISQWLEDSKFILQPLEDNPGCIEMHILFKGKWVIL
jgi:hypothetical protein